MKKYLSIFLVTVLLLSFNKKNEARSEPVISSIVFGGILIAGVLLSTQNFSKHNIPDDNALIDSEAVSNLITNDLSFGSVKINFNMTKKEVINEFKKKNKGRLNPTHHFNPENKKYVYIEYNPVSEIYWRFFFHEEKLFSIVYVLSEGYPGHFNEFYKEYVGKYGKPSKVTVGYADWQFEKNTIILLKQENYFNTSAAIFITYMQKE